MEANRMTELHVQIISGSKYPQSSAICQLIPMASEENFLNFMKVERVFSAKLAQVTHLDSSHYLKQRKTWYESWGNEGDGAGRDESKAVLDVLKELC